MTPCLALLFEFLQVKKWNGVGSLIIFLFVIVMDKVSKIWGKMAKKQR